MELRQLIHGIDILEITGSTDVEVSSIQSDSRKIERNHLFVAVRGVSVDGHTYIQSAIEKGATVIVCEEIPLSDKEVDGTGQIPTYIRVKDSAETLGLLLSNWYEILPVILF